MKLFVFIALFPVLLFGATPNFGSSDYVKIQKSGKQTRAIIDLRKWDFQSDGVIDLSGYWEFYWNELLTPRELKKSQKNYSMVKLPSLWRSYSEIDKDVKKFGFATYRAQVLLPQVTSSLGLRVNEIPASYKLFLNGREVISQGKVGKTKKQSIPKGGDRYYFFEPGDSSLEIVLQVSNYHNHDGGIWKAIEIGASDDIIKISFISKTADAFFVGTFIVMALYHFFLYLYRTSAKSSLFFGLVCLFTALNTFCSGKGEYINVLFPNLNYTFLKEVEDIWFYLILPPTVSFFNYLYPKERILVAEKAIWGVSVLFVVASILAPVEVFSRFHEWYYLLMVIGATILCIQSAFAIMRKRELVNYLLVGISILLLGSINDILVAYKVYSAPWITNYSFYLLIFVMGIMISKSYTVALEKGEMKDKLNETLKNIDKQRTNFFQNISHELRTPLTLILLPLEEAIKKLPKDLNIKTALKNSRRMLRLVNQFLTLQNITNQKELELSTIDLVPFLRKCSEYFEGAANSHNVHFELNLNSSGFVFIKAHIDSLEKIVFNYLSNALKFSPESFGKITLRLEDLGEKARISVVDNGPGISKEDKQGLFSIYGQLGSTSRGKFQGSGLGLALVKQLAQQMDASVGVETASSKGSVFWVDFPVVKPKKMLLDLLFIDDESAIRETFEKQLIENSDIANYRLVSQADEAKDILSQYRVKCVVSDLKIGGEDGVDLLSYVSKKQPKSKTILISGADDSNLLKKALKKSTADAFYTKPWNTSELFDQINEFINKSDIKEDKVLDTSSYKPAKWEMDDLNNTVLVNGEENYSELDKFESVGKEKILIIDDLADMRALISRLLKRSGYSVIQAESSKSAFKILNKDSIDLIIVDWIMPDMTGVELIEKLKLNKLYSGIPSILLTAKGDFDSKLEGIKAGAVSFISKPFDELELLSQVKNLLRIKSTENTLKDFNRYLSEDILKRYLPPNLVNNIISGDMKLDEEPCITSSTVFVSDLCDLTNESSELGPQLMAKMLNSYFSKMSSIIINNGGMIDKFIGDTIIVLFAGDNDHNVEKQIEKSYKCSIEMREAMLKLNEEWKQGAMRERNIRIGIHHGPLVMGNFGSSQHSEYTAIGTPVNVALELKSKAQPGEVLTTGVVRDLLPAGSKWIEGGSFTMKNETSEFVYYRVLDEQKEKKAA